MPELQTDAYGELGRAMLEQLSEASRFNQWMADTIAPYLGSDVLEIGAGIGSLTKLLSIGRKRYITTDVDQLHLYELQKRFRNYANVSTALCNVLSSEDFRPFQRRVDTIVCLNVLEHIADDVQGLKNVHDTLKTDGRAIILVPQGMRAFGTLDKALHHVRRYSKSELAGKMETAGFRIGPILKFNRIAYPAWIVNGRILHRRGFSAAQLRLFDALVPIWRRIDGFVPWPPTLLIAIGHKNG